MSENPENSGARTGDRIAKLLARAGIASRREVERMIAEGRVKIGGEVVTTPNTVLPGLQGVSVDGKPVKAPEGARLFVFHKPAGLLTAERDPTDRPTIYTALRNALPPGTPRVMPVGRLDFNTEGLLVLTNDGELKRAMELPSSGIPRTYRARTFGDITQAQLEELIEGIEIDGMHYGKIDANMERSAGRNQWIEMTLTEGKNREVRRVLEHFGLEVSRLIRTSYGPFALLDLPRGMAVEVRQVDVERFRKGLKAPGGPDNTLLKTYGTAPARARPRDAEAPPRRDVSPARRDGVPPARRDGAPPRRDGASPRRDSTEQRYDPAQPRREGAQQPRAGAGQPRRDPASPRRDSGSARPASAQPYKSGPAVASAPSRKPARPDGRVSGGELERADRASFVDRPGKPGQRRKPGAAKPSGPQPSGGKPHGGKPGSQRPNDSKPRSSKPGGPRNNGPRK
jgi:23S rRNA pseudouridine2605 synthase